jgi:hypothetical protein
LTLVNSRVEEELIWGAGIGVSRAKRKAPESRNADDIAILILKFALERTCDGVKCENFAATELANYDTMAKCTEVSCCLNQAPKVR